MKPTTPFSVCKYFCAGSEGGNAVVDQSYDPQSENAQSGKAVAEAVKDKVDKVETYGLANIEPTPNDDFEYTWDVVRFHNIPFIDGEPYFNNHEVKVYSKEGADERFCPTPITTIPTTLAANKQYNFGEVATLNLAFPTVANDGDVVYLTFKSGSTHTALTIDTTNTCDIEIIPEPNTGYEIYAKYNGSIWIVNYSEYTVSEV